MRKTQLCPISASTGKQFSCAACRDMCQHLKAHWTAGVQAILQSVEGLPGVDANSPEVQNAIAETAHIMQDSEKKEEDK